jgi:hypothetical protein
LKNYIEQNIHVEKAEKITCKLKFDEKQDEEKYFENPSISFALPVSSILNEKQNVVHLANEVKYHFFIEYIILLSKVLNIIF